MKISKLKQKAIDIDFKKECVNSPRALEYPKIILFSDVFSQKNCSLVQENKCEGDRVKLIIN